MVATTEAELVQRVHQGDKLAFRQLLDEHLGPVSHFVARMTDDAALAEDIAQEVFLRLWTQADRFDPARAKLSTWLHNIARNLCIDHFRKQRRIVDEDDFDRFESGDEPGMAAIEAATGDAMRQSLAALPESQRSAIVLCYYQGFSNRDAAGILGINVAALESLLARGRRRLKTLLAERSGD